MSNHNPQLSINSIQSLIEPITPPPLGQMNNKKNHQKTQSLDLSNFNNLLNSTSQQFIPSSSAYPNNLAAAPIISNTTTNFKNNKKKTNSSSTTPATAAKNFDLNDNSIPTVSLSTPIATDSNSNSRSTSTSSSTTNSNQSLSKASGLALKDLDYVKLATDQFGCRFLQKKLESSNTAESNLVRDLMFEKIQPFLLNLILDPFGNYLIQKLCEFLTPDQKLMLINSIYQNVYKISINQYGTRSLQKIVDTIDNEQQIDLIIKGFSPLFTSIDQIVLLINDLNGNHVIQKCIFKFPSSKFDFIINAIIHENNIITISTHKHGCCVLQKLLSVCTLQQIFKISIKIIQFLPGLINDQFGNYIIQFLLDIKELDFYLLSEIYNKLSVELVQLSCLKFSSNVVEKFIKKLFRILISGLNQVTKQDQNLTDDIINNTMNIILSIIDIFTVNLNILIRDNYGNYALQTLLDTKNYTDLVFCENKEKNPLLASNQIYLNFAEVFNGKLTNLVILTKELLPTIKTTSYAKKIKLKVKSFAEITNLSFSGVNGNNAVNSNGGNNNKITNSYNSGQNNDISNKMFVENANINTQKANYNKHQRHFSLPTNSSHRRNSSSVSSSNNSLLLNMTTPSNYQLNQQPSLVNNLVSPLSNLNLTESTSNDSNYKSSAASNPNYSMFFMNDSSVSASSSSSNLYQNSNMLPNMKKINDFMTPNSNQNLNLMNNNYPFSSNATYANDGSMFFPMTQQQQQQQQQQRIVSNPFPQPNFNINNNQNQNQSMYNDYYKNFGYN